MKRAARRRRRCAQADAACPSAVVSPPMATLLIYGLVDPRSGEIRYIGKSSRGLKRPRQHARPQALVADTYKNRWLREVLAAGCSYTIVVLEELESADLLDEAERRWIAHGRAEGWALTNGTAGGDGGDARSGMKASEATRERMRAIARARPPETRKRISEANRRRGSVGALQSEGAREKARRSLAGRFFSDETRRRMSESAKRRATDPAERERRRVAATGVKRGPRDTARRNISAALTGRARPYMIERNKAREWTPEMREKIGAARRRQRGG